MPPSTAQWTPALPAAHDRLDRFAVSGYSPTMPKQPEHHPASEGRPGHFMVIKGEPHYHVGATARIIGAAVSETTLRRWVKAGWTSFGMSLDVERRKGRLLVPEITIDHLVEFLERHPLPRPGMPSAEVKRFRIAAYRLTVLRPRTAYSRARQPPRKDPPPITLRHWSKSEPR